MMSNWSHEIPLSNIVLRIPDPNFLLKEQVKACSESLVKFFLPSMHDRQTKLIAYSYAVGHEVYNYRSLNACARRLKIA